MNSLFSKYFLPKDEQGSILVFEIVVIFIFSVMMLAVLGTAVSQFRVTRSTVNREQAFSIAEAGINYYQWHLAKFPSDYQNGTGAAPTSQAGFANPCYPQDYTDEDANQIIGKFCLEITAPPSGSTVVIIKSTAYATANPKVQRTIVSRYGVPSLAKYGFLTNSDTWIGNSESVSGLMHSNGGIRFDGTGNAPITSAKATYTCTATFGCSPSQTKNGVWGSAAQSTKDFWDYPVPNVDFASVTSSFSTIKSSSQSGGIYLPPSNAQGYSLVFSVTGGGVGQVSVYKVTSLRSHQSGTDVNGNTHNEYLDYNARTLQSTQNLPSNGLIYVEDKTWVEGTVKGRALVAAAQLPYNANTAPDIIIPNNITYAAKDGTNVLGLIAQRNILVSYYAPNTLEIDAALFAQNGSCQFYYYSGNVKSTITVYGTIGSYGVWTWTWVSGNSVVSGYQNTVTTYDGNLLYSPPPSFPLTTDGYQQISWSSN